MKKLFGGALLLSTVTLAMAQAWPTAKPIRIVVAYPAGGVSDTVARALADKLAVQLGTPVVIENKAGASGSLGVDAVAKAAPDGYTLGFAAVSPLALHPHLGKSPFDPQKDIAPVVSVMYSPVLLLGTSASKAADFKDLIATAQAKPRAVRWATSGQASLGHIMLEQIMGKSQVQITHVPYKGGGQQMNDALGGQYEVLSTNAGPAVLQHIKAGKFKAEIVPFVVKGRKGDTVVENDEYIRAGANLETVAKLKPAFSKDGTVTAGNASGINDGAAGVVLMTEAEAAKRGIAPLGRIVSWATAGVDPAVMGTGPIPSSRKALAKAGWKAEDLDLIEANEAFAAQACAVNKEMGWDLGKVNVNGGAIAIGHPIGASGARVLVTLLYEMQKRGAKKGLATLCIGGGMGVALCVER